MNRVRTSYAYPDLSVPHTRGDEPKRNSPRAKKLMVFPTPVGMNRNHGIVRYYRESVPHTRGDEPQRE